MSPGIHEPLVSKMFEKSLSWAGPEVKLILLQILEDRYERAAVMISSQLPISKWYDYFDEPTLADAILNRIIPKAHRIELKGKSLRKRSEHLS